MPLQLVRCPTLLTVLLFGTIVLSLIIDQKLERLNSRALRCVYNKRAPPDGNDDHGSTLSNRRLQDIAILILKAVKGMLPEYISDLFVVRNNVKNLRGTNKLVVPHKKSKKKKKKTNLA